MQNGLSLVAVLSRQENCAADGLCFISLRPLGLRDKVAVKGPLVNRRVVLGAANVSVHTDFVTKEVWDCNMVVAGAENVDPSITMPNASEAEKWLSRKKGDTPHRIKLSRITGTPSQRD